MPKNTAELKVDAQKRTEQIGLVKALDESASEVLMKAGVSCIEFRSGDEFNQLQMLVVDIKQVPANTSFQFGMNTTSSDKHLISFGNLPGVEGNMLTIKNDPDCQVLTFSIPKIGAIWGYSISKKVWGHQSMGLATLPNKSIGIIGYTNMNKDQEYISYICNTGNKMYMVRVTPEMIVEAGIAMKDKGSVSMVGITDAQFNSLEEVIQRTALTILMRQNNDSIS